MKIRPARRASVMALGLVAALTACGPSDTPSPPATTEQLYLLLVRAAAPDTADQFEDAALVELGEHVCAAPADVAASEQFVIEAVFDQTDAFGIDEADLVQAITVGAVTQLCAIPVGSGGPAASGVASGEPLPSVSTDELGSAAEDVRASLVGSARAALAGLPEIVDGVDRVEVSPGELLAEFRLTSSYEGQAAGVVYAFTSATAKAPDLVALRGLAPLVSALVWRAPTHSLTVIALDGDQTFEATTDAAALALLASDAMTEAEWMTATGAGYTP